MSNIKPVNNIIALTPESEYCQPRVAIFTPSNNTQASASSKNIYYVVLVDLPENDESYPAPTNPPVIQPDGSILFPYTLADGSPLPESPPAGVSLMTYALPVYGCRPQTTEDEDYIYYPSVYFSTIAPRRKGIVKTSKETSVPTLPFYPAYKCQPFVVKSATFPSQTFIGTLVFLNEADICTSWSSGGAQAQLLVQKADPGSQYNVSFQGFTAGGLQPGGIDTVSVVFIPDLPSGQSSSQFLYSANEVTVL